MAVDIKLIKELRDRTNIGMNDCKKALEESNGNIEAAIDLLKKLGELKGKEKEGKVATEGKVMVYSNNAGSVVGIVEVNCQTDFLANSKEFMELVSSLGDKMSGFSEQEFESKRVELIAKTGENIVLRRKEQFNVAANSFIRWYDHPGNKLSVVIEATCLNPNQEIYEFIDDCAMQVAAMAPIAVSKDNLSENVVDRQRKIFEGQLEKENKPLQSWPKIIDGKFAKWRKEFTLLEQESIKEQKKSIDQLRQEIGQKFNTEITITRFVRYALGEGSEKPIDDRDKTTTQIVKDPCLNGRQYRAPNK